MLITGHCNAASSGFRSRMRGLSLPLCFPFRQEVLDQLSNEPFERRKVCRQHKTSPRPQG